MGLLPQPPRSLLIGCCPCPWAGPVSGCCVFCCSVVRFKNGQGSNLDGGNYHVYENGSLEIKMIRKEDQGIYTCVATNILGKAENQVRLEVKGKGEGSPVGVWKRARRPCSQSSTCNIHVENAPHLSLTWNGLPSVHLWSPFRIHVVQRELGKGNLLLTATPHYHPRNYIIYS